MKKGCLIAIGVGLVVIAGIVLFAFGMTGGVAEAGNRFLSQIAAGNVKEAYESASATLKSQQTSGEFEENVKKLGLTDYASASWSNRQMGSDRGHLDGTVTTRSGGKIPVTLELIKESGTWKIFSLNAPASGVAVSGGLASAAADKDSGKQVPSDERAKALVGESLLAFNKAVQDKSFVALHEQISTLWREQISAEKLKDVFQQFIDKGIDISPIEKLEPAFDPAPAINSDGVLVLKGSYPTKPQPVIFELKYVFEDGWKLFGINVELPPPQADATRPAAPMPSEEQLQAMALESLLAFNKAVQEKDFSDFHARCASGMREKFSPEKLQEAFQQFVEKRIDISAIKNSQPSFESPPAIDADGTLVMNGSYNGKPQVIFKLKYRYEDNAWKIVGINVNLS